MSQPPCEVARCIKEYRQQKDYTQEELSNRCGFSRSYIGKIERCNKTPSLEALFTIARELEVSPSQLFQLESARPQPTQIEQQPGTPNRSIFETYHYLIGKCDTEGHVQSLTAIPRMKDVLEPDQPTKRFLWNLDFLELSRTVQSTMKSAVQKASLGESNYYQLERTADPSPDQTLDFSIHPLKNPENNTLKLAFEFFLPANENDNKTTPPATLSFDVIRRLETDPGD